MGTPAFPAPPGTPRPLGPGARAAIAMIVAPAVGPFAVFAVVFGVVGTVEDGLLAGLAGGVFGAAFCTVFAAMITYPATLLFGLPLHLLARRARLGAWVYLAGGALSGALVMAALWGDGGVALSALGAVNGTTTALFFWLLARDAAIPARPAAPPEAPDEAG